MDIVNALDQVTTEKEEWIWDTVYNARNLSIAALLSYNRYLVDKVDIENIKKEEDDLKASGG